MPLLPADVIRFLGIGSIWGVLAGEAQRGVFQVGKGIGYRPGDAVSSETVFIPKQLLRAMFDEFVRQSEAEGLHAG